ncbi:MAG: winged helix-turn-helix domain-containing protein, partial [Euryarchaeota archaeon]|nr:winged helix-turn-helix domain-containing protein [Euryarchaeota archaeon]
MPGRGQYRYYKRKLYFSTTDRILLHLLDYVGYEGEVTQPDDLTQFGIADAIALGRSTVSKAIRRLVRQGLVKSARAHVPSGKLRRTVYVLTEA